MRKLYLLLWMLLWGFYGLAQVADPMPMRGLAIAAPAANQVDRFVAFIDEQLSPLDLNTLILRVDYNFDFKSHPELAESNPLTQADVDKLVEVCSRHGISIVPQINLLGHQSWAENIGKLLEVYPEFDETPGVELPADYVWPNEDGLYCKSYCPQHPDLHKVVFALIDEITTAFKAEGFHAGMDEVFYIGDENCPRCGGMDKAELFAAEVSKLRNHLALTGKRLWIWGDRLIDGKQTGIGAWEGSMNNTHRAIDLIPKDVFICDWHYERADPTAAYFALKGFDVATCPWKNPSVALAQKDLLKQFRAAATPALKSRYQGMIQTVWSSAENFMDLWESHTEGQANEVSTIRAIFGS